MKSPFLPLILLVFPALLSAAPDKSSSVADKAEKAAAGSITTPDSKDVIARVGALDVKLDEVKLAIAKLDQREQEAIARDPALLNQVVRLLLVQRVMLNEAVSKKWDDKPQVKAAIERARETAITESYLKSMSEPPANYPSEAELQSAYELAKPSLAVGRQWKLAQIYIAAPEGSSKADLDKAEAKLTEVRKALAEKGSDFSSVAKKLSDEANSAAQGGEIGWMTEAQLQPEIRESATKLTVGLQSETVRLKDGYHILRCLDIKEPSVAPLEQVRAVLTERMRQEKARSNSQAYIAALLQQNPVTINEVTLAKALGK